MSEGGIWCLIIDTADGAVLLPTSAAAEVINARTEPREYEAGKAMMSLRGSVAFVGHQPKYETEVSESAASVLAPPATRSLLRRANFLTW